MPRTEGISVCIYLCTIEVSNCRDLHIIQIKIQAHAIYRKDGLGKLIYKLHSFIQFSSHGNTRAHVQILNETINYRSIKLKRILNESIRFINLKKTEKHIIIKVSKLQAYIKRLNKEAYHQGTVPARQI
jgi:hypothetical protein